MTLSTTSRDARAVARAAIPLSGSGDDYDPLLERIGDARFVLIGEASHGTHEFYNERIRITRRLIQEKGFHAVAVEADWPDAYRINEFVRGSGEPDSVPASLDGFQRFPRWMWRNRDVLEFVAWLRDYNDALPTSAPRVGFYGLDLYSLHTSIEAVIAYLERVDPEAASRARDRYDCFDEFRQDPQRYGYATFLGAGEPCEEEAARQLTELLRRAGDYSARDGRMAEDAYFHAAQNARLVVNAEEYYRAMFRGRVSTWNLRDTHMTDTLQSLAEHLGRRVEMPRIVVWAHNSHLGDARATDMGRGGEVNVGQLVRERFGNEAFLVGFSTFTGTVMAATGWGEEARVKDVRPALRDSYEHLFHEAEAGDFMLSLREAPPELRAPRLERAIGVIYRPDTERWSHYFEAVLPDQFDAVLHFDRTEAVEPLDRNVGSEDADAPETFPSGI